MQIEISVNKSFSHDAYNSSSLRVSLPPTLPLFADKGDRVFATRQIKKKEIRRKNHGGGREKRAKQTKAIISG